MWISFSLVPPDQCHHSPVPGLRTIEPLSTTCPRVGRNSEILPSDGNGDHQVLRHLRSRPQQQQQQDTLVALSREGKPNALNLSCTITSLSPIVLSNSFSSPIPSFFLIFLILTTTTIPFHFFFFDFIIVVLYTHTHTLKEFYSSLLSLNTHTIIVLLFWTVIILSLSLSLLLIIRKCLSSPYYPSFPSLSLFEWLFSLTFCLFPRNLSLSLSPLIPTTQLYINKIA